MKNSIITLFMSISLYSFSQTNTWNGSTDNDWHKACNWSLNAIPVSTHNVVIPTVGTYPLITGNAHCRTLSITSTATNTLTINSSGGGNLCVSSTNGGACSTTLTDNGGCAVPGSAFGSGGCGTCTLGVFTCLFPIPASGDCISLNNPTDFDITLNIAGASGTVYPPPCGSFSPSTTLLIPAMSTRSLCFNVPSGCCPFTNAEPINIPWTSTDGFSGNTTVIIRTDID